MKELFFLIATVVSLIAGLITIFEKVQSILKKK